MSRRALNHYRRLYLCTYDVADDKRRTKLFEALKDRGEHVQFSVFLCELTEAERAGLVALSRELIHCEEDQLIILDIGAVTVDLTQNLDCIGKEWTPMVRSHIF
jgi:CRISPR-associated protein Cas2